MAKESKKYAELRERFERSENERIALHRLVTMGMASRDHGRWSVRGDYQAIALENRAGDQVTIYCYSKATGIVVMSADEWRAYRERVTIRPTADDPRHDVQAIDAALQHPLNWYEHSGEPRPAIVGIPAKVG